jgi:spermidine synthase
MTYVDIAHADSPRGGLVLRARSDDASGPSIIELRANGIFVMDSAEHTSERAMATAALALHDDPESVLVGGLGLGFTATAVLADRRVRRCVVVEIEEALVGWMRDGTVPHGPALLAEERLTVVTADIGIALAEAGEGRYDLVLLDVDNGPGYLVHESNAAVYQPPFLADVQRVLRPGGALVIWSADRSPALEEALREVFGNADTAAYDVDLQGRSEQYWLHTARLT